MCNCIYASGSMTISFLLIHLKVNWAKDVRNRFVQSDLPRDLAVIEDVIREHNEARLEMKGNVQRYFLFVCLVVCLFVCLFVLFLLS